MVGLSKREKGREDRGEVGGNDGIKKDEEKRYDKGSAESKPCCRRWKMRWSMCTRASLKLAAIVNKQIKN